MTNLAPELTASYAPTSNVAALLDYIQGTGPGLVSPVTIITLKDIGIPEGNTPRGMIFLRHLGIIDEDGNLTDVYHKLRQGNEQEYRAALAEQIQLAYKPIFERINPAKASTNEISDAFVSADYKPERQRGRMVTLFMFLLQVAGIRRSSGSQQVIFRSFLDEEVAEEVKPVVAHPVETPSIGERDASMKYLEAESIEKQRFQELDYDQPKISEKVSSLERRLREIDWRVINMTRQLSELPPYFSLLRPLLRDLPREGKWTKRKRDRWLEAFAAQIDYVVEVDDAG